MLAYLGKMPGDDLGDGVAFGSVFHAAGKPALCLDVVADRGLLRFGGGPVIQIRRVACMTSAAVGQQLHEMHLPGDHPLGAVLQNHAVLDAIFNIEQQARLVAVVTVIHKYSPLFEHIGIALPHQVDGGFQ